MSIDRWLAQSCEWHPLAIAMDGVPKGQAPQRIDVMPSLRAREAW
jgi:hypothetical protein